ncbi:MAG: restriction endonuclease subunit S [Phocaeicola dorei]
MANVSSSNGLEKRPKLRFPGFDEPWMTRKLGEMGTFIKGAPLSKADISDEGTPFILYGELYTTYSEVTNSVKRKTDKTVEHQFYSKIGDVIMPTSGETPEDIATASCIMIPDVILAGDLLIYRTEQIDGRFVSFCVKNKVNKQISSVAQGKSVVHVRAEELSKISVTFPALDEQQKILSLLESIDRRIATQQKLIETLKKYKRGLHKLVFIKNRKPSWEKSALHDIASFCGGGTPSKDVSSYWDGEIGWISSSDIQEEWIDDISVTRRITKKAIDNSATKLCPEGTIAIVSRVGVGKVAIIPESLCTSQDFTNITSITGNTHYMAYQIAFRMKLEAMKTQGTSIKGVTADTIKSMGVDIPPLEEQKKIADMLTAFDSYIKRAVYELDIFLTMKKALLQQLFI